MTDFERMQKELSSSKNSADLKKFAQSPEAARIGKTVDGNALKKAAMTGDKETLGRILQQVLSTEDGKALAKMVGENFGNIK